MKILIKIPFNVNEGEMFRSSVDHLKNVSVSSYSGLTVNFAKNTNSKVIIRGLRIGNDFEYEEDGSTNREINNGIEQYV